MTQKTFVNALLNLEISPNSEVILAKRMPNIEWILIDFYRIALSFRFNIMHFATIRQSERDDRNGTEMQLWAHPTTGSRRKNLQGFVIPCGIVVSFSLKSLMG